MKVFAAIIAALFLGACATRPQADVLVPEQMLTCPGPVVPPEGRLTDNEIAEVIERLDARGDVCAGRLEDLRKWLDQRGAVARVNP